MRRVYGNQCDFTSIYHFKIASTSPDSNLQCMLLKPFFMWNMQNWNANDFNKN